MVVSTDGNFGNLAIRDYNCPNDCEVGTEMLLAALDKTKLRR
jgi:hypothetical protein